jgi:cytochrome c-type biogenesis protein CcmE
MKMSNATSPLEQLPVANDGSITANRGKLHVDLVVLVAALDYFAFMAFDGATVYYYTVSEMRDQGPTPDGKMVRISGKLEPASFTRAEGSVLAEFDLTDGNISMTAMHQGVLPDLFFNKHSEIILEGSYGTDGVFQSENVIVKCPSKYVALEEEQS